ncbi:PREDICTED: disease resistance-like protein CSA1 [Nicotiana attenuata]|uniref:Tmv resistance protein n n=2 Tax=Nicotiana attenuata TaxID=49451 RepID=A0A314L932_NICAT|nr:PREDICTED: disease resistance-like protein CSA1 [Nicotiana attenuata]OIT37607.1 tmv resistance protein n [Nicotiana attenuata]
MQRSAITSSSAKNVCNQILRLRRQIEPAKNRTPCDVFINHRGIDTKRNVAGLLYEHIKNNLGLQPFLDSKNMKPGDKLFDKIDPAIRNCKIGMAIFSPQYCDSYFCLHELSLMMESKKRVIPVFCDVKPSELAIKDLNVNFPNKDLEKFNLALEEAKYTVGLTFDTLKGDWSEFLVKASDAIMKNLYEVEREKLIHRKIYIRRKQLLHNY